MHIINNMKKKELPFGNDFSRAPRKTTLNEKWSEESLRTRLGSSISDKEKQRSSSPQLNSPFPNNSACYHSWNLNSLLGKLQTLKNPIPTRVGIPGTSSGTSYKSIFSPGYYQPQVNLKATKIYDKFTLDDLDQMQVDSESEPEVSPGSQENQEPDKNCTAQAPSLGKQEVSQEEMYRDAVLG